MKNQYANIDGTPTKLDLAAFVAHVHSLAKAADFKVPAYDDEYDANKVIEGFAEEGVPDWEQFEGMEADQLALFKQTSALVEEVKAGSEAAKADYDAAAADRKMAKVEEKKAELAKAEERKGNFITAMKAGIDKADSSLAKELGQLKDDLPEGITLTQNEHGGSQMVLAEGADESALAAALGVMSRKADNSEHVRGMLQFNSGDAVNLAVEAGIYKDKKAAARQISEDLAKLNIKFVPRSLETNARMAERTPLELRNPKVDPTAYLLVCNAAAPKKKDFENADDWKKAVKEHSESRTQLLTALNAGEMEMDDGEGGKQKVDLASRADVKPLVDQMQVAHGLQKEKDPSVKSSSQLLRQAWFARYALANLLSVTEDGVAIFQLPTKAVVDSSLPEGLEVELQNDKTIKIGKVSKAELEALIAEADAQLETMLVKGGDLTADHYKAGSTEVEVPVKVEVEGEWKVQKDPITKKPKLKTVEIPVYVNYPF